VITAPPGPKSELYNYCAKKLEGGGYGQYKDLKGQWKETGYTVFVDHVQGDAYAPPSSIRVRIPSSETQYPATTNSASQASFVTNSIVNCATCDFFQRHLNDLLKGGSGVDWTEPESNGGGGGAKGGGGWNSSKGGFLSVDSPSQFVLERSCVVITANYTEVRATLSLPAHGRTIEGVKAAKAFDSLVWAVQQSCIWKNLSKDIQNRLDKHIKCVEDQHYLRETFLKENGLVAFVANNSILPRLSGADDRPMEWRDITGENAQSGAVTIQKNKDGSFVQPFVSPATMQLTANLPNNGIIHGMGIKKGVTVIAGGGFHGKSTLLEALQTGVYNKIPSDGREYCVTDINAYKVRSEDGRPVLSTDISLFIKNLPQQTNEAATTYFSTRDASGSTSQAANISEGIEAGAQVLLLDEDTCATNFMIRDARMQMLVSKDEEPIQPFIEKIQPLYEQLGISSILVVGASGDFFEIAHTVICMESYLPKDCTQEAKDIIARTSQPEPEPVNRQLDAQQKITFRPRALKKDNGCYSSGKSSARSLRCISYGDEEVELTFVEQLVEISQARALCDILQYLGDGSFNAKLGIAEGANFRQVLDGLERELNRNANGECGLDFISRMSGPGGFYAKPRKLEIAAAVNRLRTARFE